MGGAKRTPGESGRISGGRWGRGRGRWARWLAWCVGLLVLVTAGGGWLVYRRLEGNIRTDTGAEAELARHARERPPPSARHTQNVLVIGTDSRLGRNRRFGRGRTQRADTLILLHLADGRRSVTAVSLPRDLMVAVPACAGGRSAPQVTRINAAFQLGGAACVIRTVEGLTGVRIDHHLVVDFTGFQRIVDAVGGVPVCLDRPMRDRRAHLDLPAGRHLLDGRQALGYVRSRHAGDGSDTGRIDRQQEFLAALAAKIKDDGVLLNPARLYPVLDAATSSVVADSGLDSLTELYDLVASVRHTPPERIVFLTVPREPYPPDRDRDRLRQPQAGRLFGALRADAPVRPEPARSPARPAPDGSDHSGTTAGRDTCGPNR